MPRPDSYQTRQKHQILRYLQDHAGASFSVGALHRLLESGGVQVSRTTVWRYLEALCRQGQVHRSSPDGKRQLYAFGHCPQPGHVHLLCRMCGQLLHVDCTHFQHLSQHFLAQHDFSIDPFQTTLPGVCRACRAQEGDDPCLN